VKSVLWFLCGLVSLAMGLVITLLGLVQLGWRRHGASPVDFSFLHLDRHHRKDTSEVANASL